MRLLHHLVNYLQEEELERLPELKLVGKEAAVMKLLLEYRGKELPEAEETAEALGMNISHFDKVNSLLLKKLYQLLAPEGGVKLLHYLSGTKNLYHNFKHELLFQEKQALKSKTSPARLADFYLKSLWLLSSHFYKQYDSKLADRFAEAYKNYEPDLTEEKLFTLEARRLFYETNRKAAHRHSSRLLSEALSRIQDFEKRLGSKSYHTARFFLYRSYGSYYTFYGLQPEKMLYYIEQAIATLEFAKELQIEFPNIKIGLQLQYAESLYAYNRFEDAFGIYEQSIGHIDETLSSYYYHAEKYVELALILGKYDHARQTLDDVFRLHLNYPLNINSLRGVICSIKLFLLTSKTNEAIHYLNIGKNIIDKTTYFPLEMELRTLESVYFYLIGDLELAHNRTKNHLRMLQAQNNDALCGVHIAFSRILIDLIDQYGQGGVKKSKLKEEFEHQFSSLNRLYGILLDKCENAKLH